MEHAKIGTKAQNSRWEGREGRFCLKFCVPKMWGHLLRRLGARGMGDRGREVGSHPGASYYQKKFPLPDLMLEPSPRTWGGCDNYK